MYRISGIIGYEATAAARRIACLMSHVSCVSMTSPTATATAMSSKLPTVGIIVIGDEILKGQTQDINSSFLASRLFAIGVRVSKISVIPDDIDIIANEVCYKL